MPRWFYVMISLGAPGSFGNWETRVCMKMPYLFCGTASARIPA